ncbi:GtrA family protein [Pseudalkalibacillus sp. A8]|uniref:GtrA family protein n=1 Tax=Pseudalkalibacillus sp. A8 TaxID=3382641 RepID=UPI0038B48AD5
MQVLNLEFTRFIVVGIINTFNYYTIYLFLHTLIGVHYLLAHIIAFMVSMIISFFLNVNFTFRVKPSWSKVLQFPLTQLFNMGLSSLLVYLLVEHFGMNSTVAPFLSVIFTVLPTFFITGKILKK